MFWALEMLADDAHRVMRNIAWQHALALGSILCMRLCVLACKSLLKGSPPRRVPAAARHAQMAADVATLIKATTGHTLLSRHHGLSLCWLSMGAKCCARIGSELRVAMLRRLKAC